MNIKTFIDRPVLSIVISVSIVIFGIIGLLSLPVEQYPDIAPPTVQVSTSYPGADAETIQKTVIAPLEEAINGVEDMTYITSTATNTGSAQIMIYFEQGTDPDMAAVNVQNRVSKATGLLPTEVNQVGVSTTKRQTSFLQIFSMYSPDGSYDDAFISNYVKINIQPEIVRISGVGEVMTLGTDYSMRIWLKPDVMAQYKLVPGDILGILAEQNIEAATGSFGESSSQPFQYTMKYRGRLEKPEEFGETVIRSTPEGEILRLRDVADIDLGKEAYNFISQTNGYPGVTSIVFQTAGSNATDVNNQIAAFLDEARADLPEGLEIVTLMSSNDFLYASIKEVISTLFISIILVILVVYFFLQNFRATLIPTISMVVSIVGTFALLTIAGFTINLLTLFALVLAIGTVVDNAIVVVEAVQTRFDMGYRASYIASVDAMKGITSAIVVSTIIFMAVFIPVAFMPGTSGTFYTQFGITMAIAVGISAINSLTLCPALCALILKPNRKTNIQKKKSFEDRLRVAFNTSFNAVLNRYKSGAMFFIKRRWLVWTTIGLAMALLVVLMRNTPTGLIPNEDTGSLFVEVGTAPGTSLHRSEEVMNEVEKEIRNISSIANYAKVTGYGMTSGQGSSYGTFIIRLKDWDERKDKSEQVEAIQREVYARTAHIKDANLFAFAPPMITGYGNTNGFELHLQDRSGGELGDFVNVARNYIGQLRERPEIQMAFSTFNNNYPQYQVDVDAAKCKKAGVSPADVLQTIAGYYGGIYASNFTRFSKVYRVMVQAPPDYRMDMESMNNIYVRAGNEMAPVSQFITLEKTYGSETMNRFNLFSSIAVNGTTAPGYSTGDAIAAIEEVAQEYLPRGYGYDFGGLTREENNSSGSTLFIYGIIIILTYLILAAMYESFMIPFAVILSVPFGMVGSFLFAHWFGLENNIYLQTGIIMLIGLLAKTAILLTEYAAERRRAGMSLVQSAITAAKARLRAILMTALTMVFGMLPLMFASGVGANGNSSLGTGAIGGMLVGTLSLLFLVPSLFIAFQFLQEKIKPIRKPRGVRDRVIRKEIKTMEVH